jgi:hypothetical protein
MGIDKRQVHQLKEVVSRTGGRVSIVDKVNPYIRFVHESEKILACDGALYYENETRLPNDKVPAWFWGQWDRVNDKGKAKVGGDRIELLRPSPGPKKEVQASPVQAAAPPVARSVRKKRGRRPRVIPQPEATDSESTNDGITS